MIKNRRKAFAAASAVTLAAVIVLTGTFAWQSMNQTARNEARGKGLNPGGRLHDDFNGETKKVYVENFGEEAIFARIRLDEYMELGDGAGTKDSVIGNSTAKPLIAAKQTGTGSVSLDIDDVNTWLTHKPGTDSIEDCNAAEPGFHDYFKWTMGGKTWYMPTFDKNKDSLDADVNGTLAGGGTGIPYGDYIEYKENDKEWGSAIYDADDNTVQDENVTTAREEHTAAETLDAAVITMAKWIEDGRNPDPYWVYDVDGWAYWAQPIEPNTATGLLLASIEQIAEPDEDWYYSINAVGQFATAGDWGKEDNTGFYDTSKGAAPSANAEILLNQIAGLVDVTVTEASAATVVEPGKTYTFSATAKIAGTNEALEGKAFTWSVTGKDDEEIKSTIDAKSGVLTVSKEDDLKHLVITATVDGSTSYGTYTVQVAVPEEP